MSPPVRYILAENSKTRGIIFGGRVSLSTTPLSPASMAVLRLHRDQRDGMRQTIGMPKTTDSDLVFAHLDGKPYLPNSITHAWIKLVRSCGLSGIRFHDARHTHCSLLLKGGVPLKVIQARVGHTNFGITANIYAHLSPNMQREAANSFDDLVLKNPKSVSNPLA